MAQIISKLTKMNKIMKMSINNKINMMNSKYIKDKVNKSPMICLIKLLCNLMVKDLILISIKINNKKNKLKEYQEQGCHLEQKEWILSNLLKEDKDAQEKMDNLIGEH